MRKRTWRRGMTIALTLALGMAMSACGKESKIIETTKEVGTTQPSTKESDASRESQEALVLRVSELAEIYNMDEYFSSGAVPYDSNIHFVVDEIYDYAKVTDERFQHLSDVEAYFKPHMAKDYYETFFHRLTQDTIPQYQEMEEANSYGVPAGLYALPAGRGSLPLETDVKDIVILSQTETTLEASVPYNYFGDMKVATLTAVYEDGAWKLAGVDHNWE
ncbi:MAG: hypothetical protein K6C69_00505 [Lachnospiraceae bacterium]|nr:hypothetical protein [Lachnospiraceae bacterium]